MNWAIELIDEDMPGYVVVSINGEDVSAIKSISSEDSGELDGTVSTLTVSSDVAATINVDDDVTAQIGSAAYYLRQPRQLVGGVTKYDLEEQ